MHSHHTHTHTGPILGFPVQGVEVQLHDLKVAYGTSLPMVTACLAQCIYQALQKGAPVLMEPMMNLEIQTDEVHLGRVLGDLAQRRGHILDIDARLDQRTVTACTPLAEMMGYSTVLRTVTSGTATFTLELAEYQIMTEMEQKRAMEKLTGFAPL